jgi:endoglucanase
MIFRAVMFIVALSLAICGPALAQGSASPRPADARLAKGVNLSHWFAQSLEGYDEPRLSSFVTEVDAQLLRRAGFTHVRVPVAMDRAFAAGPDGKAFVATLAKKISMLNDAGLVVVVDIHASVDEKRALLDPAMQKAFVEGWRSLAGTLARLKPDLVIFELLNEPYPLVGAQWWPLQNRAIQAIRTVASRNTVIVNPGDWSGIDDYTSEFPAVRDSNIIYTAHVYQPLLFTHQGADWVWEVAAQVAGVEWPLDPAVASEVASQAGSTEEAVKQLTYQISERQFESGWLSNLFDKLTQWQQQHGGVPVYIGEFGVYRPLAPTSARLRWHKETREAFESHGWGWAVWDYAGGFGIVQSDSEPPHRILDRSMLDALGLPAPVKTGERN